jgi:cobalt-zinc-cadmium resistance protein CzcA
MIVDGSVVLVENTMRNLAERRKEESLTHTIFESAREVARPIVFGIGIIIVYLPIVTLRDMEGKMFSPMAYTVGFALVGSLILTLTVVPAICSLLFKGRTIEEKDPWLLRALREPYLPALRKAMAHPGKVLGLTGAVFGLALALVPFLGSEFLPTLDEGSLIVQSFRLPSVSVTDTVKSAAAVEKAFLSFPEVKNVISRAGRAEISNDPMGIDVSDIFVDLKPSGEWTTARTKEELVDKMRERLENVPGMSFSFTQPIALRVDELVSGVKSQIAVKVFGDDMETLKAKGEEVARVVEKVRGAADVTVEKTSGLGYLQVEIDRAAIARYGINVSDIQDVLEIAEVRLRPVLMTAMVASLGFIPMALSQGTGAEVQRPLATVVIGGLITSTFLTLIVLPTLYRWWEARVETKE